MNNQNSPFPSDKPFQKFDIEETVKQIREEIKQIEERYKELKKKQDE